MNYNTNNLTEQGFRYLATQALKGELSKDEWSKMSKALQTKLERFVKKVKKQIKNTDFLEKLPADAIIKDVNFNDPTAQPTVETVTETEN